MRGNPFNYRKNLSTKESSSSLVKTRSFESQGFNPPTVGFKVTSVTHWAIKRFVYVSLWMSYFFSRHWTPNAAFTSEPATLGFEVSSLHLSSLVSFLSLHNNLYFPGIGLSMPTSTTAGLEAPTSGLKVSILAPRALCWSLSSAYVIL